MSKPIFLSKDQIKQIAKEYGRTKTGADFAREFEVPQTKIAAVVQQLRKHGVVFPNIRHTIYITALADLKVEAPGIFEEQ